LATVSAKAPTPNSASLDSSKVAEEIQLAPAQSFSDIGDPVIAPAGVANVPVNTGFQWAAITGADSYEIQLADNPDFSNPTDATVTNTVWAPSQSLSYGVAYFWRVRGFAGTIPSDWESNTFTTMAQQAIIPTASTTSPTP
jgi:hypothetical protein